MTIKQDSWLYTYLFRYAGLPPIERNTGRVAWPNLVLMLVVVTLFKVSSVIMIGIGILGVVGLWRYGIGVLDGFKHFTPDMLSTPLDVIMAISAMFIGFAIMFMLVVIVFFGIPALVSSAIVLAYDQVHYWFRGGEADRKERLAKRLVGMYVGWRRFWRRMPSVQIER